MFKILSFVFNINIGYISLVRCIVFRCIVFVRNFIRAIKQFPMAVACAGVLMTPQTAELSGEKATIARGGAISPRCAINGQSVSASQDMNNIGNIYDAGKVKLVYSMDCNSQFSYNLESQHGALIIQQDATRPDGVGARIPSIVAVVGWLSPLAFLQESQKLE
jgi:hypothetical protein